VRLEGRTVLIVEDEPIIALALEDMLSESGALPTFAETIEEALAAIGSGKIEAAILDVNLHGKKSYGVADALLGAGTPFIFASGYGATAHPEKYTAIPTVPKPYGIAEIEAALTRSESISSNRRAIDTD